MFAPPTAARLIQTHTGLIKGPLPRAPPVVPPGTGQTGPAGETPGPLANPQNVPPPPAAGPVADNGRTPVHTALDKFPGQGRYRCAPSSEERRVGNRRHATR